MTLLDIKRELEAIGLEAKVIDGNSLWIAATVEEFAGVRVSQDACVIYFEYGRWIVAFPANGASSYEVLGDFEYLCGTIRRVYDDYLANGGTLTEAFQRVVPNSEEYLVPKK